MFIPHFYNAKSLPKRLAGFENGYENASLYIYICKLVICLNLKTMGTLPFHSSKALRHRKNSAFTSFYCIIKDSLGKDFLWFYLYFRVKVVSFLNFQSIYRLKDLFSLE
ncbi:hypothetical protein U753_08985 [Streptococcus pseudopneumoniae 5247]|nr:hypothetical protein U753_08985 [Streptococcus pseudopneumoniae 5247]